MAGHATSDGTGTKGKGSLPRRNQRTNHKKRARQEAFRALMEHAAFSDTQIRLGISTSDALQECLDRAVALFRFASQQVDLLGVDDLFIERISPNGSVSEVPHRFVTMEQAARQEIESLAATMTSLGIAERRVRIEEAQAVLLVASIRDAAQEAGIPHDQVRLLGEHLRARLDAARLDIPPSPPDPKSSSASKANNSAAQDPDTSRQVASLGSGH